MAYLASVFETLRRWKGVEAEVTGEGGPDGEGARALYRGPLFLCEVGNGFSVGGGFLLTPDALPDDGLLDVCVIRQMTIPRTLRILPTAFSGAHVTQPEVSMHRVRRVALRPSAPVPMHADGEVLAMGARAIEVEVVPGALRALAPHVHGR